MALAGELAGNLAGSFLLLVAVLRLAGAFLAAVLFPARRGRTRVSDVLKVKSTSSHATRRERRANSIGPNQ
jgi:hypothetical protein